jgi:sugar/nucleoside kinase (ribokinase family)
MDYQVQISEEKFETFGTKKGSMRLVDADVLNSFLLSLSEDATSEKIVRSSGGSGANTIIALAQLGHSVAYGCLVGADEVGESYLNELKKLNVDTFNPPYEGDPTGRSLVLITPDAERTMNTCLGITSIFGPEHVNEQAIKDSDWIYLEGYLFASETGQEAVRKAIIIAKEHGTKIALTFSDGFIVEVFKEHLTDAIAASDLIFANRNEAMRFTGLEDEISSIENILSMTPNAVVTLSEKGAIAHYQGETVCVETFAVNAVDDTGAGDAFAAGFFDGIFTGKNAEKSARTGCLLASKVVSQLGARYAGDLKTVVKEANL